MREYDRYGDYIQQGPEGWGSSADAVKFLLLGMVIGAGVTLLLSPRNGTEIRRSIRTGVRNAFSGISEGTQNLRERGSNLLGFTRREASGTRR
jgi:gas vesicle protein